MKTIAVALPIAWACVACSPAAPPPATSPADPAPPPTAPPTPTTEAAAATSSVPAPGQPATAAQGRPKSLDDLVSRAMAAIQAGDGEAYGQLMFTLDDVKISCAKALEDVNANMISRMHGSVTQSVQKCGELDWAKAKPLGRTGGERKGPANGCSAEVWELQDIKLMFEIDGKKVQVKLDDPMVFPDGSHAFADNPRCGEPGSDILKPPDVPPPPLPPGSDTALPETPQ